MLVDALRSFRTSFSLVTYCGSKALMLFNVVLSIVKIMNGCIIKLTLILYCKKNPNIFWTHSLLQWKKMPCPKYITDFYL